MRAIASLVAAAMLCAVQSAVLADEPPPQGDEAQFSPDRLDQIVAPIALYPDSLLITIEVLRTIADAEREYASQDRMRVGARTYAARIVSEPGKHDGLYWQDPSGENPSPIGPLIAKASEEGYATERKEQPSASPYHGYLFKMLTAQGPQAPGGEKSYLKEGRLTGGFATVAYPVQYGVSGIMTFIINQQGIVFQKDLGEKTGELAPAIAAYNPDDTGSR